MDCLSDDKLFVGNVGSAIDAECAVAVAAAFAESTAVFVVASAEFATVVEEAVAVVEPK